MTVSKVPKVLTLLVILALAGAVLVAGCGSSGSTTTTEATNEGEAAPPAEEKAEEEPVEEEPAEEKEEAGGEEAGGEAALLAEGKTVFTTTCGTCHTLKAAGTTGTVGPNLDELEAPLAKVEHQVENGGEIMPAFGKDGTLSAAEVKAVSAYVAAEAGNAGQ
jgi:mono/diheme cytochrome c family protein